MIGARGPPHGNLIFVDAPVPKENLIVGEGHFARLMRSFNVERLHNSALSVGLGQGAFDLAVDYVTARKQFGRPVVEFQSVYHTLAEAWIKLEAARGLVYRAAESAVDGRFPQAVPISVAKVAANNWAREVIWDAMQLHGGDGVTRDYLVELSYRDILAASYGGGTAAANKNAIAAGVLGRRFSQRS